MIGSRWVVRAAAVLLVLTGPARGVAAEPSRLVLDYDVRYGPLRLVSMVLTSDSAGDRYRVRTVLQTEGAIGKLFPWHAESESTGRRDGARLVVERHRADGTFRSTRRTVEIDYGADGSVRSRVSPPPERDSRDAVPDALQQGTIDPITASMTAVGAGCSGRLPVFDGRRRYDLVLQELAPGDVPSRRGVYAGPARRCRAVIESRGGFWRSKAEESETPTHVDYWIAPPRPGLPPAPVYMELAGGRGTLAIVLREARALDAAPPP